MDVLHQKSTAKTISPVSEAVKKFSERLSICPAAFWLWWRGSSDPCISRQPICRLFIGIALKRSQERLRTYDCPQRAGLMRLSQNSDSPGSVAQTFFRAPCGDGPSGPSQVT